jgi:flagellar biosynthesis/type III secretory pathway protein FliH
MRLTPALERQTWQDIAASEGEQQMPYVASIECMAIERGFKLGYQLGAQSGKEQGLLQGKLEGQAVLQERQPIHRMMIALAVL